MYLSLVQFYIEYYYSNPTNRYYFLVSGVGVKVLSSYYNLFTREGEVGVKKLEELSSEYFDKFSAIGEEYHKYHIDSEKYPYTKERITKAAYALHLIIGEKVT
jgi:hypothetical protein